jgi:hypothetical protein
MTRSMHRIEASLDLRGSPDVVGSARRIVLSMTLAVVSEGI